MKPLSLILFLSLAVAFAGAAEPAGDLASKLAAIQRDGSSFARVKMETKPAGATLQLQIKQRRTANSTELVYQVIWPKERAGEAVLLKQSGGQSSGAVFTPATGVRSLTAAQMKESLLGSALSYGDALENFFAWNDQKMVGEETVNKVKCQIVESRAAKGERSGAAVVRSWVDARRVVPMRIEKFLASGAPSRRIDTNQVVSDDMNRNIPAYLTVENFEKSTTTVIDGSKLRHGVKYEDREFTPEGLRDLTAPRSAE